MGVFDTMAKFFTPPLEAEPLRDSPPPEGKGLGLHSAPADFWPHDDLDAPLADTDGLRKAFAASYVLYAIIRYRANKLCEAAPYVARENENGEHEYVPHPLDAFFREPNADEDWVDIATATQWLYDLDGRALWALARDRGQRVAAARWYGEHEFSVERGMDAEGRARLYGKFRVNHWQGAEEYGPEGVVFFRAVNPYDRYETISPTDSVLDMLGVGRELRNRVLATIRNAAVPSGFFVRPADARPLTDDEFRRAKGEVNQQYRAANSGRAGLLEGGMTFMQTSMSLADVQFGDVWREVEAACCAAFGVRPEVLGFMVGLENSPWSHMDTARRLAYEDSAIPNWNTWSRTLTRQLLTKADRDRGLSIQFDTSRIGVLKDDIDRASRIAHRMGDDLSPNERRVMVGFEPDPNPEMDVVRGKQPGAQPLAVGAPTEVRSSNVPLEAKAEDRTAHWKAFDALAAKSEADMYSDVAAALKADQRLVLRLFNEEAKGWAPTETKDMGPADIARFMAKLEREYRQARGDDWLALAGRYTASTANAAVRQIAATLGIGFDVMQPGILPYIREHAGQLIQGIEDTTLAGVRQHLESAFREGEGIDKMARRLEDAGVFDESRARLIARTESTTVANQAQLEGVATWSEATGATVTKSWLATQDERTRDEHLILDGETVGIDETFSNGLPAPEEPNCRCTMTFAVTRQEAA